MQKQIYEKPIYELKENPLSTAIYGDNEDVSDLAESIKKDGVLTALIVKPDGTIISGHRRYRAARKVGLINVPVVEKAPRDKFEEEGWIISANRQRNKTESQLLKEIERLRALYEHEGRERRLEAGTKANEARAQKKHDKAVLMEGIKTENTPQAPPDKSELDIEEIYNETADWIEAAKSGTQNPANDATQTAAKVKPEPINMRKKIANEIGITENHVQLLQSVGNAVKAGVPEAKEALERADRKEITLNRAYEITKKATMPKSAIPIPFGGGAMVEPGLAQDFIKATDKSNTYILGIESDIRKAEPEISAIVARRLLIYVDAHIAFLEGLKQALCEYVDKRGGYDDYEEKENEF